MGVGYCGGHDGDAVVDFYQLYIEAFMGKGCRSNGGSKEADTSSEFGREGWTHYINVVQCGRVAGDAVDDGSG